MLSLVMAKNGSRLSLRRVQKAPIRHVSTQLDGIVTEILNTIRNWRHFSLAVYYPWNYIRAMWQIIWKLRCCSVHCFYFCRCQ